MMNIHFTGVNTLNVILTGLCLSLLSGLGQTENSTLNDYFQTSHELASTSTCCTSLLTSSLLISTTASPTPTPLSMPSDVNLTMWVYISSTIGAVIIITVTLILIFCISLCYKRNKCCQHSQGGKTRGNLNTYTMQPLQKPEEFYTWREEFDLPNPETTSFGIRSNVNSRAPSPDIQLSGSTYNQFMQSLPVYFEPTPPLNPSELLSETQAKGLYSDEAARSMNTLHQQKDKHSSTIHAPTSPDFNEMAGIYDVPKKAKLPNHAVSTTSLHLSSTCDPLTTGRKVHHKFAPYEGSESLYDIPTASLLATKADVEGSYENTVVFAAHQLMSGNPESHSNGPEYGKTTTAVSVQDITDETIPPHKTTALIPSRIPYAAPITVPMVTEPVLTAAFPVPPSPLVQDSSCLDNSECLSMYDVPKQLLSRTSSTAVEKKLSEDSTSTEESSMQLSLTRLHHPDTSHYDVPRRLIAQSGLSQKYSQEREPQSVPTTPIHSKWGSSTASSTEELPPRDLARVLPTACQDDLYDVPRLLLSTDTPSEETMDSTKEIYHGSPQQTFHEAEEEDEDDDDHLYDFPPLETMEIIKLRCKTVNQPNPQCPVSYNSVGYSKMEEGNFTATTLAEKESKQLHVVGHHGYCTKEEPRATDTSHADQPYEDEDFPSLEKVLDEQDGRHTREEAKAATVSLADQLCGSKKRLARHRSELDEHGEVQQLNSQSSQSFPRSIIEELAARKLKKQVSIQESINKCVHERKVPPPVSKRSRRITSFEIDDRP